MQRPDQGDTTLTRKPTVEGDNTLKVLEEQN